MGLCGNFALQSGYKMQTKNLKSFFVGFVVKCHLTTYRASRNRFSGISFNDYLHYCGAFLAHFLMKINRNIISNLRRIFSLCARVGWCDVCTDFTNVIKVDVDVNEMSLLNIWHVQHSRNNWQLCTAPYYLFKQYVFILSECRLRPTLFLWLDIFSTLADHIILTYLHKSFVPDNKFK